ncbi:hypothetical protein [Variovorax sp. 350MFTsu5.1]|uniref:hypothetical protein n=1 Tax=unclassified Variovorax TaxID=663243 RepID=UPI003AAB5366
MTDEEALAHTAETILRVCDEAIARQDWTAARRHLALGLQNIGDRYLSPDAIDSSGMTLVLAADEAAQGREAVAASLERDVLHSRIVQLREKLRTAVGQGAGAASSPPSNSPSPSP